MKSAFALLRINRLNGEKLYLKYYKLQIYIYVLYIRENGMNGISKIKYLYKK